MNTGAIQAVYDKRAGTYDRSIGLTENIALGDLRRQFGSALQGETLEIAIGSGLNLPYYSESVTQAVGGDLSIGMLEVARTRADGLGRAIDLALMDAESLAFPTDSFDTVAISLALCTTPNPVAAVREMARVCRPGGRTVFLEHVRSRHKPVYWLERLWSPVQERTLGCSLIRDTVKLIEAEGFVIETEQTRFLDVFRLIVASPPPLE